MAREQRVTVGIKGVTATTHCLITGVSLKDAPINYDLGENYYVSVNTGNELTPAQVAQISSEILPHISSEVEIEIEEEGNNDNWS